MTNAGNTKALSLNVTSKRARARGEMVVAAPVSALPPAVERAGVRLPRMTLTGIWQERAELVAGTTWKTFGEDIVLTFEPVDAATTRVVATSTPHVPTTIFDYGQGKADVTEVLNAVAAEL
ncbi:hypothetical protein [Arthrobacter caoxuetaonis]|uniref:Uncharacterized protein n=1 Tax=Arthrobacter caoxuetaonis TaxID=2886935 RepID=A0A9X1MGE7_9MICC|nr:hypothetical protein [Arthrobacter caoxuetaonis]MCC3298740.1 hypothetical protein [Arthrobacter caoxuetaonis]USQ57473.1 hypothetical protein NF551_00970 [Arthrobacter caoxuetaonis]